MNKAVLECTGIAAGYVKGLNILNGVDLVLNSSEIVSIIGPNGAGKSTLLKAIVGIIKINAGRFYLNGSDKTNTPTYKIIHEGLGYVPQVNNVFPSLSLQENLEMGNRKKMNKKNFDDVYKLFINSDISGVIIASAFHFNYYKKLLQKKEILHQGSTRHLTDRNFKNKFSFGIKDLKIYLKSKNVETRSWKNH